jgi:hypothetical protein
MNLEIFHIVVKFEVIGVYEKYEGESSGRMESCQRATLMKQKGKKKLRQGMKKVGEKLRT